MRDREKKKKVRKKRKKKRMKKEINRKKRKKEKESGGYYMQDNVLSCRVPVMATKNVPRKRTRTAPCSLAILRRE